MDFIDQYCERTAVGLWDEPLNAVSNLAFLFAAWLCWRRFAYARGGLDKSGTALMGLVGAIGVGSGLFHTFATRWSLLADVIPIAIFIHSFLYFALRRFFALSWQKAAALTAAYAVLAGGGAAWAGTEVLNGSAGYIPPMAALFAMGAAMHRRSHEHGVDLMVASGVFLLSLAFRTADMAACAALPFGTHFMWHVLNGVALYGVGRAYMLSAPGPMPAPSAQTVAQGGE